MQLLGEWGHAEVNKSCVTALVELANSIKSDFVIFDFLASSYVLILIAKVKLNVLYKAVYLSRSIRPNKDPKIESQKSGKSRLSPSLSFTLFESQIQTSNATLHCPKVRILPGGLFSNSENDPRETSV